MRKTKFKKNIKDRLTDKDRKAIRAVVSNCLKNHDNKNYYILAAKFFGVNTFTIATVMQSRHEQFDDNSNNTFDQRFSREYTAFLECVFDSPKNLEHVSVIRLFFRNLIREALLPMNITDFVEPRVKKYANYQEALQSTTYAKDIL